ncbi:MAG: hypothetical protein ABR600_00505 [Actinomycetota bacterium]
MCGAGDATVADSITSLVWTTGGSSIIGQLQIYASRMSLEDLYGVWQDFPVFGA